MLKKLPALGSVSAGELSLGAVRAFREDALAAGLIDQVTEPETLIDAALAEAERLSRISADVYEFTKRQLQGPARERIDGLRQADDEASTRMWASPVVQEAINGFMSGLKK